MAWVPAEFAARVSDDAPIQIQPRDGRRGGDEMGKNWPKGHTAGTWP